ncbi:MAG: nucleoside triphosphate pyrophosphohydrolase [Desulfovibrionales bacterium]
MSTNQINPILQVIEKLLGPNGCPWDKKQTPATLCDYIIEEAYELVEAIRQGDETDVSEEIGDVLFLLFFVATLYEGKGLFSLQDAIDSTAAKMIRRHPHVFGDLELENQEELLANWERIKQEEKKSQGEKKGVFSSLPASLPPLLKAYRINSKSARIGFTWENTEQVEQQIHEEWRELKEALSQDEPEKIEEEIGDLLFTFVEYARRQGIKSNTALDRTNRKFLHRFHTMEQLAQSRGLKLTELPLEEKNQLWDEAKREEEKQE